MEDCTIYVSDDPSSGNLSGLAPPSPSRHLRPAALRTKSSKKNAKSSRSEKCVECKQGFQFLGQPPLQIQCKRFFHLKMSIYPLFRCSVILSLKTELRRQGPGGELASTMTVIKDSPEAYLEYMKVPAHFADQIFLVIFIYTNLTEII